MCGRFAQYSSRDEYFEALGAGPEELTRGPELVGRYNVAPGTKVLLLSERDGDLAFELFCWGYGPEWWDKAPLINARGETAASGRMFKPLWEHARAVVPADGWFEWQKVVPENSPISFTTVTGSRCFCGYREAALRPGERAGRLKVTRNHWCFKKQKPSHKGWVFRMLVPGRGIEPRTRGFSIPCSTD